MGVEHLNVFGRTIHAYFCQLFLHAKLVQLDAVAQIGNKGGRVQLLYLGAVALHVEFAHQPVRTLVDEVDELGLAAR